MEFFENRIRPLFVAECCDCHSSGAKKLKGDLHLDTRVGYPKRPGGHSIEPFDGQKFLEFAEYHLKAQ